MPGKKTMGLRALVVDDEPELADVVSSELNHLGLATTVCSSVAQAKLSLEKDSFDLVISDVRMPSETGVDLLTWIKKRDTARPRVILMTAFADLKLEDVLHLGADALFMKPFDFDAIAMMVAELESGKAQQVMEEERLLDVELETPLGESDRFVPGRGGCFVAVETSTYRPGDVLILKVSAKGAALHCTCLVRWCRRTLQDPSRPAGLGLEYLESVSMSDASGASMAYAWSNVVPFIPARCSHP